MKKEKFNNTEKSILQGLNEAIEFAHNRLDAKQHNIVLPNADVHKARDKLGLTQKQFAETFGVSLSTIRNWEQGRRCPTGAARVLLKIIEKEPKVVKRVLCG